MNKAAGGKVWVGELWIWERATAFRTVYFQSPLLSSLLMAVNECASFRSTTLSVAA
jgi:hypothetical protein